jgi:hypothetical protein
MHAPQAARGPPPVHANGPHQRMEPANVTLTDPDALDAGNG